MLCKANEAIPSTSRVQSNQEGYYQIKINEILDSQEHLYIVEKFLGKGSFGLVLKCRKVGTRELFAVKLLKNLPQYHQQGKAEISILKQLGNFNADEYNFVRAYETFSHKTHTCLVFEHLKISIHEFLIEEEVVHKRKKNMSLISIRPIVQQLLKALVKLREIGIIHADLKPENIMLIDPEHQPYRVKVIDFGSSFYTWKAVQNMYIQTRFYRAPEIILCLPFDESIDIWSVGCVMAELFMGRPLYPGSSSYNMMRYISTVQGVPSNDVLKDSTQTKMYFYNINSSWKFRHRKTYLNSDKLNFTGTEKNFLSSLEDVVKIDRKEEIDPDYLLPEIADRREFLCLLMKMLALDQKHRIRPEEAIIHPFITQQHLNKFRFCRNVVFSKQLMKVCGAPFTPVASTTQTSTIGTRPEQRQVDASS